MHKSFTIAAIFSSLALAACNGSPSTSSSAPQTESSSSQAQISSSLAVSSSSESSLSFASSSGAPIVSSSSASSVFVIPNAASNERPYCRTSESDPDGDGWGWENAASCIVYEGAADPGPGNFDYCLIGEVATDLCMSDTGSWGEENGNICLSQSMCPGMGAGIQAAMREDLINPNSTAVTEKVYDYLRSQWGNHIISGQMDLTWRDSTDMLQRVKNDTGKEPAMMGYDFMNYGIDNAFLGGLQQTEEAIAYWQRGGLVSLTWHWRDPNVSGATIGEFYTDSTDFQIPVKDGQLDTQSQSFANMVSDIDLIAGELLKLQNAGVPVLWRPLHEASGGWFWWGRTRTDNVPPAYAQVLLWRYIYERLTQVHGLNNLIWVWNGQSGGWYPGDDVVDIVSFDVYADAQDYGSQQAIYDATKSYPQQVKMVAMSENSNIPDPDQVAADGAWWLWFMVWNDVTEQEGVTSSDNFWTGEYYNTNAHKRHVYNHELVITLDELPDF